MINVKIYKNGYEISGHDLDYFCSQVSLWNYITRRIIHAYDNSVRSYSSGTDGNDENINDGYSWLIYDDSIDNQEWNFEDFVIALEKWNEDVLDNRINIQHINRDLQISADTPCVTNMSRFN